MVPDIHQVALPSPLRQTCPWLRGLGGGIGAGQGHRPMLKRRRDREMPRMSPSPNGPALINRIKDWQEPVRPVRLGIISWGPVGTLAVNMDDFGHAVRFLAMGWQAYEILCGADFPGPHLGHKMSDPKNFRVLTPTHSFLRQQGVGPISVASASAGATSVPRHAFRMLGGQGQLERPNRRINTDARHDWRMGIRLAPRASGASTIWLQSAISTPPAIRKAISM